MLEGDEEEAGSGSPAWMATFADLMSLLMCFFVLLLSFSEMDVLKYRQIAGSMKEAFGVQNKVEVKGIPKGTSIIAQEFSPGQTRPSPMDTIQQVTSDTTRQSLRVGGSGEQDKAAGSLSDQEADRLLQQKLQSLMAKTEEDADKLRALLDTEVESGKVDIESEGRAITIRIREQGSFNSGSASLNAGFLPVMASLRDALQDIPGKISVEGHTDNLPITGARFHSNWDLSSSRATSVTHALLRGGVLLNERFVVVGYADTRPVSDNASSAGRAMNRRVELVIRQGMDDMESMEGLGFPELDL